MCGGGVRTNGDAIPGKKVLCKNRKMMNSVICGWGRCVGLLINNNTAWSNTSLASLQGAPASRRFRPIPLPGITVTTCNVCFWCSCLTTLVEFIEASLYCPPPTPAGPNYLSIQYSSLRDFTVAHGTLDPGLKGRPAARSNERLQVSTGPSIVTQV